MPWLPYTGPWYPKIVICTSNNYIPATLLRVFIVREIGTVGYSTWPENGQKVLIRVYAIGDPLPTMYTKVLGNMRLHLRLEAAPKITLLSQQNVVVVFYTSILDNTSEYHNNYYVDPLPKSNSPTQQSVFLC